MLAGRLGDLDIGAADGRVAPRSRESHVGCNWRVVGSFFAQMSQTCVVA